MLHKKPVLSVQYDLNHMILFLDYLIFDILVYIFL